MKIVGTKLDNSDCERFEEFCVKEGMTKSEVLRDLIKDYCRACEEGEEMEWEEKQRKESKVQQITKYKLLDDDGNVIFDSTKK